MATAKVTVLLNGTVCANELCETYKRCLIMLDLLDIPYGDVRNVTVNTRAKQRWGQCKTHSNYAGCYHDINISNRLLVDKAKKGLEETILHELIHTCPGCQNHGEKWLRYVRKVNNAYGYNIKRTNNANDKGVDPIVIERNYKYVLQCENGHTFRRQRMSDFVKHPSLYKCNCGASIRRIN